MSAAGPPGTPADGGVVRLISRTLIGTGTIEVAFSRPEGFQFRPGQSIRLIQGGQERDYSIASGPADPRLVVLVRLVERGWLSALLASAAPGRTFRMEGPHGFFTFQPGGRVPPVFVASGTGAAPFLSMVRGGARGFTMVHGVHHPDDLLHPEELRAAAARFVACVSAGEGDFRGRVTDWARSRLAPGAYDFYLCGRGDMIGEMELIIDERFPGSLVHTETFF